jgi:hypothetical protein
MRLVLPLGAHKSIRWLERDLAIGRPVGDDGWTALRARGVRAVVDLSDRCDYVGLVVRDQGMRYLRLSAHAGGLPEAEELHIVTSWVLHRIREGGSVLIHDATVRGNDALVGCAVLIKDGLTLKQARARLRDVSDVPLTVPQVDLLHQFVAQRALAANQR